MGFNGQVCVSLLARGETCFVSGDGWEDGLFRRDVDKFVVAIDVEPPSKTLELVHNGLVADEGETESVCLGGVLQQTVSLLLLSVSQ